MCSTSRAVQTRIRDKDSDVAKRILQVGICQKIITSFHQVEKISKLILGEIREIRRIMESEDSQVRPVEAAGEEETKEESKGGAPTLASKEQEKVVEVEDPGAFCWCC